MGIKTLVRFECSLCTAGAEGRNPDDVPEGAVVVSVPGTLDRAWTDHYLCKDCVKLVFEARGKSIQKKHGS